MTEKKSHLFKLYVSLGGGVSLCCNITGICSRISAVMSAQVDPRPNAKGCGVDDLKGVASSDIDFT